MRNLLLAVALVAWACAEGVAPPRQLDKAADATADATGEEAATLVQSPSDREQGAQRDDEREEDPTPAPTLVEQAIPDPPTSQLATDGSNEKLDRLKRKLWELQRMVEAYKEFYFSRREWRSTCAMPAHRTIH